MYWLLLLCDLFRWINSQGAHYQDKTSFFNKMAAVIFPETNRKWYTLSFWWLDCNIINTLLSRVASMLGVMSRLRNKSARRAISLLYILSWIWPLSYLFITPNGWFMKLPFRETSTNFEQRTGFTCSKHIRGILLQKKILNVAKWHNGKIQIFQRFKVNMAVVDIEDFPLAVRDHAVRSQLYYKIHILYDLSSTQLKYDFRYCIIYWRHLWCHPRNPVALLRITVLWHQWQSLTRTGSSSTYLNCNISYITCTCFWRLSLLV